MAYTVGTLITNAWYLSGIVARELETVTGQRLEDGLDLLNAVLAIKTANKSLIPYYSKYTLALVAGQGADTPYYIPGLLETETFTFNIQSVRYSLYKDGRRSFQGDARVDNITSLPYKWYAERTLGGSNLFLYFSPDQNYPAIIWGKFGLDQIAANDFQMDLTAVYDYFYIEYLRYAVAEYMCSEFNVTFQPQSYRKLQEYENILKDVGPLDTTLTKMSYFNNPTGDMYGQANLGHGWTI